MQMSAPGAVTTQQGSGSPAISLFSTPLSVEQPVSLLWPSLDLVVVWRRCVSQSLCLCLSSQPVSLQSDWLSTQSLSVSLGPSCLHKRRKVIGGILLCKLRTTAKLIVILTMIQESLDHLGSTVILSSVMTWQCRLYWVRGNNKVIQ